MTTIIQEMLAAARGIAALVTGNRRASDYFDFSQRGLAGAGIAFLASTALSALLPMLLGAALPPGTITKGLLISAALLALQVAFSAFVLRQMKRLDGLVPYLVAYGWTNFFSTIVVTILAVAGVGGEAVMIVTGILVLIIEINIARLIVTLKALQIAMLIIAQLVGAAIGLIVLALLFPVSPEVAALLQGM